MKPRWMVRGDIDGFVGLFVDNLLQLLLIVTLCPLVAGIPLEVVTAKILPAAALSVMAGNFYYAWQARRLARRTGREDVTALPYGINTVSLIAFVFLVMGPVWRETNDPEKVLQAGLACCLLSGLMELVGAFFLDPLRRWAPRAALLSALSGVAITFISMGFAFQIFASPAIAVAPMILIIVAYGARLKLPLGMPAGLLAILIGAGMAWILRWAGLPSFTPAPLASPGLYLPVPDLGGLEQLFSGGDILRFLPVVFPMALFNVVGSLQSLESAEAAGDRYPTTSTLAVNGAGSLLAGFFGSAFPTTLYIGHPGWKAMGARTGYSALNGVVIGLLCFTGTAGLTLSFIPMEATLGILIWIGVVMAAQAFRESPGEHALAVAVGLIPALAAWALLLVETTLGAVGSNLPEALPKFGATLFIDGVISLSQGFLLTSMGLAAVVAFAIDRKFVPASVVCFLCAGLSATGVIHAYKLGPGGVEPLFGLMVRPDFVGAYGLTGLALLGMARFKR